VRRYQALLVVVDAVSVSVAAVLAYLMRFGAPVLGNASSHYLLFALAAPPAWVAVIALNRGYEGRFVGVGATEIQRMWRASLHFAAITAIVAYATASDVSRGFVLLALPLAITINLLGRYGSRKWLHWQRRQGAAITPVMAVGGAASVAVLARMLERDRYAGMRVVGACLPRPEDRRGDPAELLADVNVPIVGDVDTLVDSIDACGATTVAVLSGEVSPERLRRISWQLEGTEASLVVSPGLTEVAGPRLHIQPVAGLPLLYVEKPAFTGFRRVLKNAFDRTCAGLAIAFLLPVFAVVALAIRLEGRGPIFFRQVRVGRDGERFRMLKFRSMYPDAESRLAQLKEHNESDGLLFKIKQDPRVTRVGRIIRRFSLDELPQLFNVVKGDMSLVGPRPPLPSEVAGYGFDVRRRLLVKTGLTGLWQISGRSDLRWDEGVRLDLRYVENWSLALDITILWKTVFAVVRGSGAY
jgi:exopolysaccharide biosynthesis polyprenyl glycosylphosphotransferase